MKGLSAEGGEILLTPNEHRVAQDRPDCFWLYVVARCRTDTPELKMRLDPASLDWSSISKIQHYTLSTRVLFQGTGS